MLLMVVLALQGSAPDTGTVVFHATAPRIEATVTIDGDLSEPVWAEAARLTDFHQYQPVDSRPAEERDANATQRQAEGDSRSHHPGAHYTGRDKSGT